MKIYITITLFFLCLFKTKAQSDYFEDSYNTLTEMLEQPKKYNFKKAVFSVENAFLDNILDSIYFNKQIGVLTTLAKKINKSRTLNYNSTDKNKIGIYASVFSVLRDSIPIKLKNEDLIYIPFSYDFSDPFGKNMWESMFVTKLVETKTGNCHSLPYLYKILVEDLGETANLALAPNHIYVKHRSKRDGWYNTELTSGIFPIDAWLMASGYIHIDAIRNGVYMKALNNNESIALCLIDLAQGYKKKYPYDNSDFVVKCCTKALEYFPRYINAMLLINEAKREKIEKFLKEEKAKFPQDIFKYETSAKLFKEMEMIASKIHELGYRKMPEQMYLDWLVSLQEEKQKYSNKKISTFKTSK